MKWYQNKYVQATAIALATGAVAALLMYVGTITDGLDLRHTIKAVGLAFLGPFSILVTVLPKITDIITPTVRIVSQERVLQLTNHPETSIETNDADTTVVFGEPPMPPSPNAAVINTQSYTPARRTQKSGETVTVKPPPVTVT